MIGTQTGRDPTTGDLIITRKGNVVILNRDNNKLRGALPASMGSFSKLEGLSLAINELTGEIPASLGNLQNLLHLELGLNELSGRLPAMLANLSKLKTLSVVGNRLHGGLPAWLGNFPALESLHLSDNLFSVLIPADLGKLGKLVSLRLDKNCLSGTIPPSLGDLSNLVTIDLSKNQLTGEAPLSLGGLPKLRSIDLSWNNLESGNLNALAAGFSPETLFLYLFQKEIDVLPDLQGVRLAVVEDSVNAGGTITIEYQVHNSGTTSSGPFSVSLYLSADSNFSTAKERIGTDQLPDLAAGMTSSVLTETIELPLQVTNTGITSAPNQFYVGMIVDASNEIAEQDECNNIPTELGKGFDRLTVIGPAVIKSIQFDAHHVDHLGEGFGPGDVMTVDWDLKNVGYGDAEPFRLEILFDPPVGSRLSDAYLGYVEILTGLHSGESKHDTVNTTLPADGSDAYEPTGNGL